MVVLFFAWLGVCLLLLVAGVALLVRLGHPHRWWAGGGLSALGVLLAMGCVAASLESQRMVSDGMAPTLRTGDRLVVLKLRYEPRVGDVVLVRPPLGAQTERCGAPRRRGQLCPAPTPGQARANYVSRIVAGPGDRVTLRGGRALVDGRPERAGAPATVCREPARCDFAVPITVPEGHWLLLNDARDESDDSRVWGPIDEDSIVGRMWLRSDAQ